MLQIALLAKIKSPIPRPTIDPAEEGRKWRNGRRYENATRWVMDSASVHFQMSCFIGAVSFSLTGMAPVIGCRRRPMLAACRTSYKFRDEGLYCSGSSGTLVNISGGGERRYGCPKWTVHFSARPYCALGATNHPCLTPQRQAPARRCLARRLRQNALLKNLNDAL